MYCSQELLSVPQMPNCLLTTHDPSHDLIQNYYSFSIGFLPAIQLDPANLHIRSLTKFYTQFLYQCDQSVLNGNVMITHLGLF